MNLARISVSITAERGLEVKTVIHEVKETAASYIWEGRRMKKTELETESHQLTTPRAVFTIARCLEERAEAFTAELITKAIARVKRMQDEISKLSDVVNKHEQ